MKITIDASLRDLHDAGRTLKDIEDTLKQARERILDIESVADDIENLDRFSIVTGPEMSRMMNKAPEGEWLKWSDVSKLLGELY